MKIGEIRARLTRLYEEKFEYLESALAYAVDEDVSDAEAFDATIRLTGELNAVVESAEALFVDLGKVKIDASFDLALIRRRVLAEKREREARRVERRKSEGATYPAAKKIDEYVAPSEKPEE